MMNAMKIAIKTETDAIAFYKEAALKQRTPSGERCSFRSWRMRNTTLKTLIASSTVFI